ncbi:MAG: DNA polymerase III subunit alpha, partial [Bacteroidota bacterium]
LGREQHPPVPRNLPDAWIIYPSLSKPIEDFRGNEFLGIRPEHVGRLWGKRVLDFKDRLVAWSPATFLATEDHSTHCILRAIDHNSLITALGPKDIAQPNDYLASPEEMQRRYDLHPFLLENAKRLLTATDIDFSPGPEHNLGVFTGSPISDYKLLEKLAREGIRARYQENHHEASRRLDRELQIIQRQNYCAYFLISWDLIRYAGGAGYAHIGRGSGANSIIAYALRITDVDPLLLKLPFERFLNEFRASPPDFDIDFSHADRDDVLDYVFTRYGHEHAALLATYATFKGRSIIREVGKVYGLPKPEIDRIIAAPNATDLHPLASEIFAVAPKLQGLPSHLSIHAGGV